MSVTSISSNAKLSAVVIDTEGANGETICNLLRSRGIEAVTDDATVNKAAHDVAVIVTSTDHAIEALQTNACGPTALILSDQVSDIQPSHLASLALGGADAVLPMTNSDGFAQELTTSLNALKNGQTIMRPDVARVVADHARSRMGSPRSDDIKLTKREIEILKCVGRGETVRKTAATLGISAKTVENLQSRLFRKLNVKDRTQAYARASALGLLRTSNDPSADARSNDSMA